MSGSIKSNPSANTSYTLQPSIENNLDTFCADPLVKRLQPYATALILLCISLGIIARAAQYLSRQSYWHDEALVVINLLDKDARQLAAEPLSHDQAAPPLFLILEHAALRLGYSEYTLRLAPLLLGIASLVLLALLARASVSGIAAVIATGVFAFSDKLIWHSAEVKQYSGDVFTALLLLYLALVPRRPVSAGLRLLVLGLLASALLWFSFTTVFIFAGISLAFAPAIVHRRIADWVKYGLANLPLAVSLALLYWLVIRHQRTDYLDDYWDKYFVSWRHLLTVPWWLVEQTFMLFNHGYPPLGALLFGLAVAGWRQLRVRGNGVAAAALAWPIALNLLAAALHQYPYGGSRVTLYLMGPIFILAAAGMDAILTGWPHRVRRFWWAPAGAMLGLGLGPLLWHLPFPRNDSRIRPIADYVGVHFKPGDAIYAFDHSGRVGRAWEFQCYWRGRSPVINVWPKDLSTLPTGRIWLTYAYHPGSDSNRLTPIYNDLSHGAKLIDHFEVRGGKAFLFERPGNPPSTSPAP